ncbi:hypothetical protein EDF83_3756 [Pseudomonas protegens]|uniref:hypothetical protein n=1 Tax=Pseudomonas TaxID=286 RepID=UPI0008BD9254|nr:MULTISPECIES: hypothetical protein [Pseudomonas]MBP5099467.1 hypothetical protein [Pseudomonas protegens]MBP5101615.1 hypothetical protein [Pseudomonas protegens]MBP5119913.1 hypothetical protein [Pseudomonas protegens]MBP5121061.1 hypothetical protein [Pseudomonas protegens]MBP5130595.1 hypothetical protein [Pseudomonas protegens]
MSRSLGLREDQRQREHLAQRIGQLFPLDAWWLVRQQAMPRAAGAGLPAKRPDRLTD